MSSPPSSIWVIELQGGGMCSFDGNGVGGCSERGLDVVSPYSETTGAFPANGTLSTEPNSKDPDFANANWVKAHYCSNDGWTGSNVTGESMHYTPDGTDSKWSFTGHLNVVAMIEVLASRFGLDDSNPSLQIHFTGGSAGGFGVAHNAYFMKEKFPRTATKGNLMLSSWSSFIPLTWDNPDYPYFGIAGTSALEGYDLVRKNWRSVITPACLIDHPGDPEFCMGTPNLYPYITNLEANRGMDLPILIFQNRQDQLYMANLALPTVSATISASETAARDVWLNQMNSAMGITPGVPNASSRIKWLYAPSDPLWTLPAGNREPNVHPPLDYATNPPDGAANSTNSVLSRFWNTRGRGIGRGLQMGEVHTYDCNWVPGLVCK